MSAVDEVDEPLNKNVSLSIALDEGSLVEFEVTHPLCCNKRHTMFTFALDAMAENTAKTAK